jgi:hypothetical protein
MQQEAYPVRFTVDYPDRPLDRLTTGFRIFVAIPILIVLGTVSGGGSWESSYDNTRTTTVAAGGLLFFGPLLMILFRQKYPRWWFDWNLELQRFGNRVGAYLALMDDRYPATDEHQSVHLDYPYPDAQRDLNRWLPLVKWLLAMRVIAGAVRRPLGHSSAVGVRAHRGRVQRSGQLLGADGGNRGSITPARRARPRLLRPGGG